jgi:hypothetical protein
MSDRKMTPKGFLHKTTTKAANSAAAFLASYREYLTTGELAPVASPIIRKLDEGTILPTPALKEIQSVVMAHIIASDQAKVEHAIEEAQQPKKTKPWIASVLDAAGNICTRVNSEGETEDLVKSFDLAQEADRWVDRRLFEGASDWYGQVKHATMNVETFIQRNDAIARILKQPKGAVMHQKAVSTKTLGFGVKAKQDRSSFSRG